MSSSIGGEDVCRPKAKYMEIIPVPVHTVVNMISWMMMACGMSHGTVDVLPSRPVAPLRQANVESRSPCDWTEKRHPHLPAQAKWAIPGQPRL